MTDNLVSLHSPQKKGAASYLFLTEEDGPKLKTLIGFLRRSHHGLSKSEGRKSTINPVPHSVEKLYFTRQIEEAIEKIGSPLCNDFKVYGKCQVRDYI